MDPKQKAVEQAKEEFQMTRLNLVEKHARPVDVTWEHVGQYTLYSVAAIGGIYLISKLLGGSHE